MPWALEHVRKAVDSGTAWAQRELYEVVPDRGIRRVRQVHGAPTLVQALRILSTKFSGRSDCSPSGSCKVAAVAARTSACSLAATPAWAERVSS
eukprot:3771112-Amphidinium_carterae.1